MMRILDKLTGHRRITLGEGERAILFRKGRVMTFLAAGEHRVKRTDLIEIVSLKEPRVTLRDTEALVRARPDLVADHMVEVRTGPNERAVIERDNRLFDVLAPDSVLRLWAEAGPFGITHLDTSDPTVPKALAERLTRSALFRLVRTVEVPVRHVGVMTVRGGEPRTLDPGTHAFWADVPGVVVKVVDMRLRSHDVTGHEILTKDRVTLRVNLTADFRVVDTVRAVTTVHDFEEALHRAIGLAFRRTLGALTLDTLLADKVSVDAEAASAVRSEMAELGVEVGAIALKDVILPGEMRDILTRVVAAEKEAEANVIRRREETNATRSLLNTAKVMAENPVMLRLKELEALESIAGKVDTLTVHNGTAGLMSDLVKLRD